jgi:hypothetical protein
MDARAALPEGAGELRNHKKPTIMLVSRKALK